MRWQKAVGATGGEVARKGLLGLTGPRVTWPLAWRVTTARG